MEAYIKHLVGFAGMCEWMERWRRHSSQIDIDDNLIHLGPWLSRRFLFGLPRRPVIGSNPFMGAQPEELTWLSMMQWGRACLETSTNRVYLVSSRLRGDDKNFPDLPAFALGIHVETQIMPILQRFGRLDVRQVWVDEDGALEITRSPSLSPRLSVVDSPSAVLSSGDIAPGHSFEDILKTAIDRTNRLLPPSGGRINAVVG